jgi:hypothetical protein
VADPLGAARGTTATATMRLRAFDSWQTSAWAQLVRSCLNLACLADVRVLDGRSLVLVASALSRDGWVGGNAACEVLCRRGCVPLGHLS